MRRKRSARHNPEKIKGALAKLESGKSLTKVAEEMGVSKGLLSYWKNRPQQNQPIAHSKAGKRSKKFIEECWKTILLAFGRLQEELKKEKFQGIRDLGLTIAILSDKLAQTSQNIERQVPPSASGLSITEDTWMILRRHREAKSSDPRQEKVVEVDLGGRGLEQQKKESDSKSSPQNSAPNQQQTRNTGEGKSIE